MAYRSDVEALEARVRALSDELAARERERDEVARMLAEARWQEQADRMAADYAAGGPQRRLRRRLTIASAAVATLLAGLIAFRIGRHKDDRIERAMQRMDQFTDEMCQCHHPACAQSVSEAMTKWATELQQQDFPPPNKIDDETMKRAEAMARRMTTCMQAALDQAPISTNGAQ